MCQLVSDVELKEELVSFLPWLVGKSFISHEVNCVECGEGGRAGSGNVLMYRLITATVGDSLVSL